jgi:iron complex outermembrane receptor protein
MIDLETTIRRHLSALVIAGVALLPLSAIAKSQPELPTQQLKSLSLEQLGEVQVTTVSKQPEEVWQTPAAVFVVTHDDILRSGATSIPELLRLVPGVEVSRGQSSGWAVGIRGFDSGFSKGLLVLIDGRSVYTPLFEGVYWDVQDVVFDNIDRIEVIRGPGGTIWGPNAVNGVINIITRKAADTQGAYVSLAAGGAVDRFTGELRLGLHPLPNLQFRVFAKGFDRGPEQNPGGDPYDSWHQERGGFRVDWQPTTRDSLTASSMVYGGETGAQNAVAQFYPVSNPIVDSQQKVSGGNLVLRWDHQLVHQSSFYLDGYFDRTDRNSVQFTETRNTFDLDFIGHIANLSRQDLILGAGLRESPSNAVQNVPTFNFLPNRINNYLYSLFAQDTFRLVPDRLSLTLGSKFADNNYSGWGVEPSAQLLLHPGSTTTLWASVARALRIPGRLDRDVRALQAVSPGGHGVLPTFIQVEGNPNFAPEVLIGWSAGFRQLLWSKLYVDIAAFHNQHDNIESFNTPIITVTFPTTPYPYLSENAEYANGLRGVSDGIEIAPDWKPARWIEMRGSFSHVHVALHSKAGFSQAPSVTSIEGSSPHREASVQGIVSIGPRLEIVPDYRFVSARPAENTPSYETADARVSLKIDRHLDLHLTGRNLQQPRHEEGQGNNNNPVFIKREVFGGLIWSW